MQAGAIIRASPIEGFQPALTVPATQPSLTVGARGEGVAAGGERRSYAAVTSQNDFSLNSPRSSSHEPFYFIEQDANL